MFVLESSVYSCSLWCLSSPTYLAFIIYFLSLMVVIYVFISYHLCLSVFCQHQYTFYLTTALLSPTHLGGFSELLSEHV